MFGVEPDPSLLMVGLTELNDPEAIELFITKEEACRRIVYGTSPSWAWPTRGQRGRARPRAHVAQLALIRSTIRIGRESMWLVESD